MSNHRFISAAIVTEFVKMALSNSGFKRGVDYTVSDGQIFFKCDLNNLKKRKVTSALAHNFPQYTFGWESSRMLIWC